MGAWRATTPHEASLVSPAWLVLAQLAAGVVHLTVEAIGYRVPALDSTMSDAEAETRVQQRWQSSMMLRLALIEAIAIGSLVVPCALEGGLLTYAVGAPVPLTLMAMHVWPLVPAG